MTKINKIKKLIMILTIVLIAVFLILMPALHARALEQSDSTNETEMKSERRDLPVIMYHSVLKSKAGKHIVTPEILESDLKALKENGYESITSSQLTGFVEGRNTLSKKPVMITFDDGFYNNWFYAAPILKKYGFTAIINVIGSFTDISSTSGDDSNPNYSHLTWAQIGELAKDGVFEIGNHTYNMHTYQGRVGITKKAKETEEEYRKILTKDVMMLQEKLEQKSNVKPTCFAYPFGRYNEISEKILAELGFKVIFTCYEKSNIIKQGDYSCLRHVRRFNRSAYYSTDNFIKKISVPAKS